jgi:hypothetical protein
MMTGYFSRRWRKREPGQSCGDTRERGRGRVSAGGSSRWSSSQSASQMKIWHQVGTGSSRCLKTGSLARCAWIPKDAEPRAEPTSRASSAPFPAERSTLDPPPRPAAAAAASSELPGCGRCIIARSDDDDDDDEATMAGRQSILSVLECSRAGLAQEATVRTRRVFAGQTLYHISSYTTTACTLLPSPHRHCHHHFPSLFFAVVFGAVRPCPLPYVYPSPRHGRR